MDNFVKIESKNILVVGDVMLDIYYRGIVERISPEAPVPVFLAEDMTYRLGGAANVAVNIAENRQSVAILSYIGQDENGKIIKSILGSSGICTEYLVETKRPTTTKCRLLAGGSQQVIRIDKEDSSEMEDTLQEKLFQSFIQHVEEFDLVILSDYMKGIFNYDFTRKIIVTAKQKGIHVLIDVKDKRADKYKDAYMLKPNRKELGLLTGLPVKTKSEVKSASEFLCRKCNCDYVLTTCGADGMILVNKEGRQKWLSTTAHEVFDVTGAGDTVIAYMGICLANKVEIYQAMVLANYAAGLQVSKIGTSIIRLEEVINAFQIYNADTDDVGSYGMYKRLKIDELKKLRQQNKDRKIVFTNGCFDLLHIGHIRYLKEAASLGDILVVGVNSDASVRRLKGTGRPINVQEERLELLAAMEFVDYLVLFEEDTPLKLIENCEPDVLVKGGDYEMDDVVGKEIVEKRGGEVKILSFVEGKSTTGLIKKIISEENN